MAYRPNTTVHLHPEPEVAQAQVRAMLAPFFTGRGPAPAVTHPTPKRPAPEVVVV